MISHIEGEVLESQKQLSDEAARAMEVIERKSNALVEGFECRLVETLRRFEQKATSELSVLLEQATVQRLEESARQLESHAVETERKLREGLTASGESVVEEARKLAGVTRGALESLSQTAAEECRQRIEEFRSKSLAMQKQIEDVNQGKVERTQHDFAPVKPRPSWRSLTVPLVVFLVGLVPAATAIYLSTRPVMRLRPEPPSGFADASTGWSARRAIAEQELALAYWKSAIQNMHASYHYGASLPADPPAAFFVDPEAVKAVGANDLKVDLAASRAHYWRKLREVWGQSQAWEQSRDWDADWLNNFLSLRGRTAESKPSVKSADAAQ